jgi:8-oxo-dGTP pyrophosphatase MutT (NUDIX family)
VIELPQDLPVLERDCVRVVVIDVHDEVLLFKTHELTMPELGHWWEQPGGGIDAGETYVDAAVRELREETGIASRHTRSGRRRGGGRRRSGTARPGASSTRWSS